MSETLNTPVAPVQVVSPEPAEATVVDGPHEQAGDGVAKTADELAEQFIHEVANAGRAGDVARVRELLGA